jgi:hypothetical protein
MYRIIGADGKEYGPITAEQLRQWMAEGRANFQTMVQLEGTPGFKPLGEYAEFAGPVPGAAPTPPPSLAPAPAALPGAGIPAAAGSDIVTPPAIALIVLGALNILISLFRILSSAIGSGRPPFQPSGMSEEMQRGFMLGFKFVNTVGGPLGVVGALFILFGGIMMLKRKSYGLCMAASILAMIPCLSACCPIGIPIGIWALVILAKPEVKALFR